MDAVIEEVKGQRLYLYDGVEMTPAQRSVVQRVWLWKGSSAHVTPEPNGWVYVCPYAPTHPDGWTGHMIDEEGYYRFPGGGRVWPEDM